MDQLIDDSLAALFFGFVQVLCPAHHQASIWLDAVPCHCWALCMHRQKTQRGCRVYCLADTSFTDFLLTIPGRRSSLKPQARPLVLLGCLGRCIAFHPANCCAKLAVACTLYFPRTTLTITPAPCKSTILKLCALPWKLQCIAKYSEE